MKPVRFLTTVILASLFSGCVTVKIPHSIYDDSDYSKFFEHHPRSIVVVPAYNKTTAVEAPEVYATTITEPLAERGYYVFPVSLTQEILLDLGVTDEGILRTMPPDQFKNIFGADAVLYVTLQAWTRTYLIVANSYMVGGHFTLVDTSTGEVLWNRTVSVRFMTTSLWWLIVPLPPAVILDAIHQAIRPVPDDRVLGRFLNRPAFTHFNFKPGLPAGPYHADYQKDHESFRSR